MYTNDAFDSPGQKLQPNFDGQSWIFDLEPNLAAVDAPPRQFRSDDRDNLTSGHVDQDQFVRITVGDLNRDVGAPRADR